ncbi:hypothetical protein BLL52_2316 [Rhodoferax antarcticus ANT.BR]|uniref:Uncharacterized protein n=1 Tax=Rhodoferax antarcticus ANT.BR TaxID=1111071 RepID=A0A1Q8YDG3_9BURK|nr:hypothetical protein BLL52_2316 [Rhodoferax antarcticus ANT.BR]
MQVANAQHGVKKSHGDAFSEKFLGVQPRCSLRRDWLPH